MSEISLLKSTESINVLKNEPISFKSQELKIGHQLTEMDWKLLTASEDGDLEGVYNALWGGANVDCCRPIYNLTPLILAARNGHVNIIPVLLEFGADYTLTDSYGANAFHWCVAHKSSDTLKYLINKQFPTLKVLLNKKDVYGATPLHFAAVKGWKEGVLLLLENKVDTFIQNNDGKKAGELNNQEDPISQIIAAEEQIQKQQLYQLRKKSPEVRRKSKKLSKKSSSLQTSFNEISLVKSKDSLKSATSLKPNKSESSITTSTKKLKSSKETFGNKSAGRGSGKGSAGTTVGKKESVRTASGGKKSIGFNKVVK